MQPAVSQNGLRNTARWRLESRAKLQSTCTDADMPMQVKAQVEDLHSVLDDLWEKVDELKEAARSKASTKATLKAAFSQLASAGNGAGHQAANGAPAALPPVSTDAALQVLAPAVCFWLSGVPHWPAMTVFRCTHLHSSHLLPSRVVPAQFDMLASILVDVCPEHSNLKRQSECIGYCLDS